MVDPALEQGQGAGNTLGENGQGERKKNQNYQGFFTSFEFHIIT